MVCLNTVCTQKNFIATFTDHSLGVLAVIISIPAGIPQLSDPSRGIPATFIPITAGNPRIPAIPIPVHTSKLNSCTDQVPGGVLPVPQTVRKLRRLFDVVPMLVFTHQIQIINFKNYVMKPITGCWTRFYILNTMHWNNCCHPLYHRDMILENARIPDRLQTANK